ncbi:hypothetical protein ZWY2020_037939 [Hordeum vulgare]|nr:hypothetical protein ZWY2020_037939 [Hordeum vulgare]
MPLLPSSSSWMLSRSATPFTTATAFRSNLHRARAIAGRSCAFGHAVRGAKRVWARPACGWSTHRVNIGKERLWLKLPVDRSKFVPVALKVLVVQEKYRDWVLDGVWKLPTGFIQEVRTHRSQKKYAREPSERSRKKQGARGLQQAEPAELQRSLDQILS